MACAIIFILPNKIHRHDPACPLIELNKACCVTNLWELHKVFYLMIVGVIKKRLSSQSVTISEQARTDR